MAAKILKYLTKSQKAAVDGALKALAKVRQSPPQSADPTSVHTSRTHHGITITINQPRPPKEPV